MNKKHKDLTGKIFGKLTVLYEGASYVSPKGWKMSRWTVQCDCEKHTILEVREDHLLSGNTTSCGCVMKNALSEATKKYNEYDLSGDYGIGWTTNTDQEFYFDLADYDKIKDVCWTESPDGYICGRDRKTTKRMSMHSYLGFSYHDHINRNKRDNRSSNLRPCVQQENCRNGSLRCNNTSGVIGVSWSKAKNAWIARVCVDYKEIYLGQYQNKDDAIRARLRAEVEYYGEFAPQQHLYEKYNIVANKE